MLLTRGPFSIQTAEAIFGDLGAEPGFLTPLPYLAFAAVGALGAAFVRDHPKASLLPIVPMAAFHFLVVFGALIEEATPARLVTWGLPGLCYLAAAIVILASLGRSQGDPSKVSVGD